MKQVSEQEAVRRCAAYCSVAERCIRDVAKKLEQWEIPLHTRKNILARLQKEGFLDEARYCRAFVNDKTRFAKWGKNKIIYALRQKQVAEEEIRSAIRIIDADDHTETLKALLQQKRKSVKGKDEYEIRMKLMRFAAGRGFDLDEINKCLTTL
ncbi:MAG: RecX family transcriptional regulator [Dysgonamonadaceae bacterium]|jgi:regulatory protein|nr:RecX family transcriptional regulator [Dysgonamonadaceae bacterium]